MRGSAGRLVPLNFVTRTMHAVVVDVLGGTPRVAEVEVPSPEAGQLLVKVRAAGINPFDWQLAEGALRGTVPNVLPFVLGNDAAGVVEGIGAGVTEFAIGDRVFGQLFHTPLGEGTFAEHTIADAGGAVARLPDEISDRTGAALPTAALTALGLIDAVTPGVRATVLIVGASGGVGSFATQIAASPDFRVLATASSRDAERVKTLGAAVTFDHHAGDLRSSIDDAEVGPLDAIVDLVSDASTLTSLSSLVKAGGQVLSTIGSVAAAGLIQRGIEGTNFVVQPSRDGLERLLEMVSSRRLTVPIEAVIPLDDAPAAIARLRRGGARGKTVIEMS
jgi:NADPH2:quinone reductase